MIGALFETNIKYDLLDQYLQDYLVHITYSNNVNVVIDLKSVYRKAYRTNQDNLLPDARLVIEDISSHVINMIGFYRNYLAKKGKQSTFYILYSQEECKILKENFPGYKDYYYEKYFNNKENEKLNNYIQTATKQIQTICKYTPDVYFINTSLLDEFCYFDYFVKTYSKKNEFNILLADDPILFQSLNNNTVALNLKGINTQLVTNKNVMNILTEKPTTYSNNLLTLLLSIAGVETYSISNIHRIGYKKALGIIDRLVKNNVIADTNYITMPTDIVNNKFNGLDENNTEILTNNKELIIDNYNRLYPLEFVIRNEITLKTSFTIFKPIVTKKHFSELNNKMFLQYPINVTMLLKGTNLDIQNI